MTPNPSVYMAIRSSQLIKSIAVTAADVAKRAAPDGYALLVNTLPFVTNRFVYNTMFTSTPDEATAYLSRSGASSSRKEG